MARSKNYEAELITCRECVNSKPITGRENLNHEGKPFLCTCPYLPVGWKRQLLDHKWSCSDFTRKRV